MPKAGKKHFPYTKAGKKRAQKYAKKHGLKVKGSKNPGYSTEGTIMNKELYKRVGRLFEKSTATEAANDSVWNTYKNMALIFLGETEESRRPTQSQTGTLHPQTGEFTTTATGKEAEKRAKKSKDDSDARIAAKKKADAAAAAMEPEKDIKALKQAGEARRGSST